MGGASSTPNPDRLKRNLYISLYNSVRAERATDGTSEGQTSPVLVGDVLRQTCE